MRLGRDSLVFKLIDDGVIVSPNDGTRLTLEGDDVETLVSETGDRFPIVEDVPILLNDAAAPNFDEHFAITKDIAKKYSAGDRSCLPDFYMDFDKTIQHYEDCAGGYAGLMYDDVPFKGFSLPFLPNREWGRGKAFLDVGSGWGRWVLGAGLSGYAGIGVDPTLTNILHGKTIAKMLNLKYEAVVADARHLPFRDDFFGMINCYSVLHHMDAENFESSINSISRVLKPGGKATLQISNSWSPRHFLRTKTRNYGEEQFSVRYRSPVSVRNMLEEKIGATRVHAHGAVTTSTYLADTELLRPGFRALNVSSYCAGVLAEKLVIPKYFADSLYFVSSK